MSRSHSTGSKITKRTHQYQVYHVRPLIIDIFEPLFSSEAKIIFKEVSILLRKKIHKKSLELIKSQTKLIPGNLELLLIKRLIDCFSEKYSEILDKINDEISLKAREGNFLLYSLHAYIVALSHMGVGEFKEALQVADDLVEKFPDESISYGVYAVVLGYNLIFEVGEKKSDEDSVLFKINKAISITTDDFFKSKYMMYKGKILGLVGLMEESLEFIEQSLKLDSSNFSAHIVKIGALFSTKRHEEAFRLLDDCIKKFPKEEKDLLSKKASFLATTERVDEAIDIVEKILDDDDSDMLCNLGYYHMYIGDTEESINIIQKAIKIDPNSGNLYDSYGEFLLEENRLEDALEQFLTAMRIEPDGWSVPYTQVNIASIFLQLGELKNAESYLNDAEISIVRCACGFHKKDELTEKAEKVRTQINNIQNA